MEIRELLFKSRGWTPVPFLAAAMIWAQPTPWHWIFGVVLTILGESLRIWSVCHAGGATRTRQVGAPALTTTGPYALIRNPLYLANILLYTGFAAASNAVFPWLPLAAVLFFLFQYGMIISLEEETLRNLFGQEYTDYLRQTPRIFPRRITARAFQPPVYKISQAIKEERSTLTGIVLVWIILIGRVSCF